MPIESLLLHLQDAEIEDLLQNDAWELMMGYENENF